jgi:UTP-glucose-1-phosphate uridylyltransferase
MKTAAEEEGYGAANMTAHKRVQFQVCLSDAQIEATTGSIADTHRVVNQFKREICGITSTDQRQFSKKFSIHLVEVEAWWQANGVQQLWKTIEQRAIHFGYPTMHVVSHISE